MENGIRPARYTSGAEKLPRAKKKMRWELGRSGLYSPIVGRAGEQERNKKRRRISAYSLHRQAANN
jgi:hypothetical protein